MVNNSKKKSPNEMIRTLKSFLDTELNYVLHYDRKIWLCEWDSKIINEYYAARKLLKKELQFYK